MECGGAHIWVECGTSQDWWKWWESCKYTVQFFWYFCFYRCCCLRGTKRDHFYFKIML